MSGVIFFQSFGFCRALPRLGALCRALILVGTAASFRSAFRRTGLVAGCVFFCSPGRRLNTSNASVFPFINFRTLFIKEGKVLACCSPAGGSPYAGNYGLKTMTSFNSFLLHFLIYIFGMQYCSYNCLRIKPPIGTKQEVSYNVTT